MKIAVGAHRMCVILLIVFAAAFLFSRTAAAQSRSYWNHNGSIVYLVIDGDRREFYYDRPRAGMREEGVQSGTLLFTGTVSGDTYDGTAFIFSARCGTRSYHVAGPIAQNGARVVLSGAVGIVDGQCRQRSVKNDLLVFDYLYMSNDGPQGE